MLLFAGVGLASIRVKKDTTDDYLVAGRGMHPALAALSAVSTWNSGYMFIGAIGFTYVMGYNVIWLAIASTLGQLVAWMWLYKYIQEEGHKRNVRSLSSLVGDKAGSPEAKLAAVLSVLFLSIYAAAQLTSGGKALLVMMGWSELVGILIGFVLVVAYCYAGGIRASIWTDAIQSCVMIIGSMILCWIALGEVGGFSGLNSGLESQDTALTNIMPPDLMFGFSLWVFAFLLGGLAVAGQPQVVSRVMTLGSEKDRKQAMIWFFVWQTPFIILMTFVGLASRVLFPKADSFDPELGLPMLAMDTMPAIGVGMILASIFAATMSTADSQVLACTAAITDDIKPEWREDHKTTKKVTLVVAAFATAISIGGLYVPGGDSVFKLVVLAVYGLGSIFVPLLIIRWMGYKPDSTHSIVMMSSAFIAVIAWSILPTILGWKSVSGADGLFPSVPGMGAAFAAHFIMSAMRTPDVSSLGRYNWPDRNKIGTFAAVIMIPLAALEVTYLATAPDSMNSSEPAPDSMWNLTVEFEPHFEEQVINIGDGATDSFQFDIPADAIGVSFMLNYSESNEGGIGSQCDDVESSYDDTNVPSEFRVMWNLQNITGQNCGENPLGGIATWSGFMQTNTYENHQITISELTVEKDAGEIIFDVKVDVNQATPINGDNGEEITLMMRYNTLVSYELTEAE
jgi:sodium/proline symporter